MLCPECHSAVEADTLFCPNCGKQLGNRCAHCSAFLPFDAKFCTSCGRPAEPLAIRCVACGEITYPITQGFCPACGHLISSRCAGCGARVRDDWKVCPTCGRRLGTQQGLPTRLDAQIDNLNQLAGAHEDNPNRAENTENLSEAEKYNAEGIRHYEAEEYDESIEMFRKAIELDPENILFRCNLAVSLDESDQSEEAFQQYQLVLSKNPNDITALLNLGYLYSQNEQYDKARDSWEKVTQIAPNTPEGQEAFENLNRANEL